jgi:hypothetical protein
MSTSGCGSAIGNSILAVLEPKVIAGKGANESFVVVEIARRQPAAAWKDRDLDADKIPVLTGG